MKTNNHLKSILTVIALASCCLIKAQDTTQSGLDPSRFNAVIDGKSTALYVLTNDKGNEACITNYGARLVSLMEAKLERTHGGHGAGL